MEKQQNLQFRGVDILKIDFDARPLPPEEMENVDLSFNLQGGVDLRDEEDYLKFSVYIIVKIEANPHLFLKVRSRGKFLLSNDFTEEVRELMIYQNAPAIMFPYVRSFIATLTNNCGSVIYPIQLPPIKIDMSDFKKSPPVEE